MSYQDEYRRSVEEPEKFWREKSASLPWFKEPEKILSQDKHGIHHWFADGEMNTCYMAVDHHVKNGRASQIAIAYDSPVTNTRQTYTYKELLDSVAKFAGVLKSQGVEKGDRIIIYMPMIPESVIAMLACARIGAIHSLVFGGFAAPELAARIDDAKPKLILSASCGIEVKKIIHYKPLLDESIRLAKFPVNKCIIYQRKMLNAEMIAGRDLDWQTLHSTASEVPCTHVKGEDPLYILYTSGTTGKPKGIVRENGGHAVALKYSMKAVYGVDPGDVYWAASDVGWVVGHSYIVYGPLLHGCTTILFEGKPIMTPDAGTFWRIVSEYGVKVLFTAPTAYRAIKKEDPNGEFIKQYDISCLKIVFAAGERLDPPTYDWLKSMLNIPVIDNWWQTETGWPIASNLMGIEFLLPKAGSATKPVPGYQVKILDESGRELGVNEQGNITVKLPLPPSCMTTVWGDIERFKENYLNIFPGYYLSGDGGYIDEDNYLFVMGRVDDVINISGHRLSTGEMEEIVGSHHEVAECAVVAIVDQLKGEVPMGFVVLKTNSTTQHETIKKELVEMITKSIGAIACYKQTIILNRLPKTRSGKILRKTIRHIVNKEEYKMPSTIDDPAILDEIKEALNNQI